ncbi:hypothetical protein BCR36DRAFT_374614 [Piromyces finnis]|uniref:Uncharacterized protein n=1 Tax=Piromyces finnis TaxID=1754191 RepID=A0A1Y1UYF4_9FUNG|nr:hypothetical protein BCR36DRAFT_374614 [Piromyces finnis]|eukprot:ORX42303.1 hypothetical protein BCR36DRAFT_374614 [Piromyces finnis]
MVQLTNLIKENEFDVVITTIECNVSIEFFKYKIEKNLLTTKVFHVFPTWRKNIYAIKNFLEWYTLALKYNNCEFMIYVLDESISDQKVKFILKELKRIGNAYIIYDN